MLSLFSRLLHRKARTGRMVIVNQHDIANSRRKQNQLSPLTPERVKQLYELYRDGKYADPMLAWEALEEFDETLATVVDRRQSALGEMQWSIATDAQAIGDDSALAALAEEQQEYLAAHFRRVANLTEAVKWLGMASFRKFAHLEVVKQGRDILWLPINQWLLFRPLHEGKWYYNQDVQNSPARGEELDESRLIVREVARPIDLPCMYLIVSKMHAITQWDGFLDVFGIPSMFIEMPQGTNEELRQEFIEVVNSVIGEGRGVLPSGAAVKTVETTASGGDTFTSRADWCDKGIVRRGTGGQLTVLTEAGSGTLAGNAQQETFRMLAAADAADIASVINRQYTRRVLEKKFEGQPHLAYWTLDYANENEQKQKTDAIVQLATAGWRAKDETVSEIVGFEVTTAQPQAGAMPGAEGGAAPGGLFPNATPEEPDANIVTNRRMEADAAAGIYPGEFEEEDEEAVSDDATPMTEEELAALKSALAGGLNADAIAADAAALEGAMQAVISEPEESKEGSDGEALLVTNCDRNNHQNGCSCRKGPSREHRTKGQKNTTYRVNQRKPMRTQVRQLARIIDKSAKDGVNCQAVVHREGIGWLNVEFGGIGNDKKSEKKTHGHGVRHALEKRHRVNAWNIADTIMRGDFKPAVDSDSKVVFTRGRYQVIVDRQVANRKFRRGKDKNKSRISSNKFKIITAMRN